MGFSCQIGLYCMYNTILKVTDMSTISNRLHHPLGTHCLVIKSDQIVNLNAFNKRFFHHPGRVRFFMPICWDKSCLCRTFETS